MDDRPAKAILWPNSPDILIRVAFLYVGQGSSTLVMVASGDGYKTLLVDVNMDKEHGGIDVPSLVADLIEEGTLDVFVNTHPHKDHLRGITALAEKLGIDEVWHSGHVPGKDHEDAYKDLQAVIEKVEEGGGSVTTLEGSREEKLIGDAKFYVLAPAQYVADEVQGEEADARSRRIHEQCVVMKFGAG